VLLFFFLAQLMWAGEQPRAAGHEPPDTIFVNADIYTGAVFVPGTPVATRVLPRAQALAVKNGRIVAVGTTAEVRKLKGKDTREVDLGGHFVMPGFNDAHTHLASGGFEKLNVNLVGTRSLQEMLSRIAAQASELGPGEWLVGRGWDHTLWPDKKLPSRADLDKVTGDHPAMFHRVDGHIAVVNSAALKVAGITAATVDPPGGKIDKDASGQPTGILRESPAMDLVASHRPNATPAQRRRALELALADAASHGVTSAQDYSDWADFLVYEEMENAGKLTLRITEWLPFDEPVNTLEQHRAHHDASDLLLHTGMLKGFMDGSLGSRTAALLAPYADDPGNKGLPQYQPDRLDRMAEERALAGFQLGFHAIGDAGSQLALDAFRQAEQARRERDPSFNGDFRFRIEHAQIIEPAQFRQFHQLGVIASMQPNHLLTDMNWAEQRVGSQRAAHSYAWAEFLGNGVLLAFGTDYPVEPITPFRGMYAAVSRKNEQGTAEYFPEQKLTTDQAIAAYTSGAAYAEFAEKDKGTLEPGMVADFVVLDHDLTKVSPSDILKIKVLRTVVGAKTVFSAE
jgi:predicted amidohydrolase YtcJ